MNNWWKIGDRSILIHFQNKTLSEVICMDYILLEFSQNLSFSLADEECSFPVTTVMGAFSFIKEQFKMMPKI